jgi:hypothetical protein
VSLCLNDSFGGETCNRNACTCSQKAFAAICTVTLFLVSQDFTTQNLIVWTKCCIYKGDNDPQEYTALWLKLPKYRRTEAGHKRNPDPLYLQRGSMMFGWWKEA